MENIWVLFNTRLRDNVPGPMENGRLALQWALCCGLRSEFFLFRPRSFQPLKGRTKIQTSFFFLEDEDPMFRFKKQLNDFFLGRFIGSRVDPLFTSILGIKKSETLHSSLVGKAPTFTRNDSLVYF